MRKNNTQKIDDIVNEYLKALNIDGKLKEVRLIRTWDEVVGKTIARSTREIFIKDRKLFVKLNSSIIRNELFMLRDGLKKALNDRAGEILIDEIILK
jgi:predicted nucleic acid-binding Zn ribbon protein